MKQSLKLHFNKRTDIKSKRLTVLLVEMKDNEIYI